jgi:thiamine biosynthesis lipoprotein
MPSPSNFQLRISNFQSSMLRVFVFLHNLFPSELRFFLRCFAPQFTRRGGRLFLRSVFRISLLCLLGAFGCASPLQKFDYIRPKMGTGFHMVLYASDVHSAQSAADAAFARVDQLNAEMSDYDNLSELSLLSERTNNGPMQEPVKVSDDLWRVLSKAKEISELSDGAFDVTVGPFVRLWRRSRAMQQLPTPQRLAAVRASVGYRLMELYPATHSVRLTAAHMRLDLGGIAKGFAAEEALHVLAEHGVSHALVGAAGDIAAGEPPPGKAGWVIGFENPGTYKGTNGIYVQLRNQRVSTSGDTYRFVEIDGKRYSHIIDPTTGLGQTRRIEASAISNDGMTADTLALVLCIWGPQRGLALIDRLPETAGIVTTYDSGVAKVYRSRLFSRYEVLNIAPDLK